MKGLRSAFLFHSLTLSLPTHRCLSFDVDECHVVTVMESSELVADAVADPVRVGEVTQLVLMAGCERTAGGQYRIVLEHDQRIVPGIDRFDVRGLHQRLRHLVQFVRFIRGTDLIPVRRICHLLRAEPGELVRIVVDTALQTQVLLIMFRELREVLRNVRDRFCHRLASIDFTFRIVPDHVDPVPPLTNRSRRKTEFFRKRRRRKRLAAMQSFVMFVNEC